MSKKQLKIKLLPNGQIQMETVGITGKKCLDYIPFLEEIADVKITKTEYTKEYYETENMMNVQSEQIEE